MKHNETIYKGYQSYNRNTWYAVLKDCTDTDWGYGSYDLDEAKEMASGYKDAYIAVIDETGPDPMCIDEIEIDEEC